MQQTEWIRNEDTGNDELVVTLDDGQVFLTLIKTNDADTTYIVNNQDGALVTEETEEMEPVDFITKLINLMKLPFEDLKIFLRISSVNILGYEALRFVKEHRDFIMDNDPNCVVPKHQRMP